jgi:hypothetical protein
MTRGLASGFPGSRNSETPIHIYMLSSFRGFSGFRKSGFRDMRIQGNLPLGIPGAETPKHQTLTMLYHFGVSQVGISRHAKTRKLALGYPGCRNAETPNSNHAIPFRGFASRDFATCEDKETCPWVSRVPKRRNTKL